MAAVPPQQHRNARPAKTGEAVLIDPIAGEGMSLEPLYDLFRHPGTVKVFHAARQDLEIFFVEGKTFPDPLFDTQVAAMVCGFGEQVGYETLVKKIARENLDKTSRFTDWSRRPLSDAQMEYALADVTHLRMIYEWLAGQIAKNDRQKWVEEELSILTDPATYTVTPEDAWLRVKTRTTSGRFLAVVKELARFRETYAQTNNVPRARVMKDDALLELASTRPATMEELGRSRLLQREGRRADIAEGILAAIKAGQEMRPEDMPKPDTSREQLQVNPALADLLQDDKARAELINHLKQTADNAHAAAPATPEESTPATLSDSLNSLAQEGIGTFNQKLGALQKLIDSGPKRVFNPAGFFRALGYFLLTVAVTFALFHLIRRLIAPLYKRMGSWGHNARLQRGPWYKRPAAILGAFAVDLLVLLLALAAGLCHVLGLGPPVFLRASIPMFFTIGILARRGGLAEKIAALPALAAASGRRVGRSRRRPGPTAIRRSTPRARPRR